MKQSFVWMRIRHIVHALLAAGGISMHVGTALLRIGSFFPFPRLVDFGAFYASAWALTRGLSPYGLTPELAEQVLVETGLPFRPPMTNPPPLWPWLLQPLALVDYRAAAWIWFLVNLLLLIWCAWRLGDLAGCGRWHSKVGGFFLVLTFGPVFLDLTLGQTSVVLLTLALLIGWTLRPVSSKWAVLAAVSHALAATVKLYPAIWLADLALFRRWKLLALSLSATVCAFGLGVLVRPDVNQAYWLEVLPERIRSVSAQTGLDDQSLAAWMDRLGRPQTYSVPGLDPQSRASVTWTPSWSVSPKLLRWTTYLLLLGTGLAVALVLRVSRLSDAEGGFYLWVLYALLVFPHIERYNHALLLPAMVWIWGRYGRQRVVVLIAYFLVGLSRLNHVWAVLLPAPWGPLASGFGVIAVLLLGGAVAHSLSRHSTQYALEDT